MEAGTSGMVLNHLLFQKAIIDEGDRSEKIDRYLGLLAQAEAGNEMVPSDPIDRSVQLVFELVLSNNYDPWDINLMEFTRMYTKKMHAEEINFIVAGKLMYMAWSILKMQSEEVLSIHEQPMPGEAICSDYDMDSMDQFYDDPVLARINTDVPGCVDLTEAVRHQSTRPVSLIELLDAFEEAKRDAEIQEHRQKAREVLKLTNEKFDDKAHKEDYEKDVADTWDRIVKCGNGPINIEDLFNGDKEDRVMVFVALLFLAKYGKIALWQDDLPYGQIFLEIKIPWDIGTIEETKPASVPVPQSKAVI
jgi:segregation and condensation protein A